MVQTPIHIIFCGAALPLMNEGEALEYLAETEIMILNRGHRPTFVTSRAQEVLDLTLVSKSLADVIQGWRVDDKESSDHKYIRYEAHLGIPNL